MVHLEDLDIEQPGNSVRIRFSKYSLRTICSGSPASVRAELMAALIAKRTLIDSRIGGSPVAETMFITIIYELNIRLNLLKTLFPLGSLIP